MTKQARGTTRTASAQRLREALTTMVRQRGGSASPPALTAAALCDLASYLFRRHGRIVSREALLEQVWNLSPGLTTRTVDTHISRLRKKLALSGEHGWKLTSVYQHGYRLEQT